MAANAKSFWQLTKQTFTEFAADDCASMAAGLAYYTIFSLPPLLVIVVTVAGLFWSPEVLQGAIEDQIENMVGKSGKEQIHTMMAQAGEQRHGLVSMSIGIVVLLVGATGVFAQLQHALNKAWEVEPDPNQGGIKNFIIKRLLSLGMILAIAFLLLVSLVLTTVLSAAGDALAGMLPEGVSTVWPILINFVVSFLVIWLLFTSMFKFLPDANIEWRDVWIGGAITTLLFMIGKALIGAYLGSQASGAGPVILLLLWIYYSAMILLLGAEFTQAWAKSYGKEIEPEAGAVRVERAKAYQRPAQKPAPTAPALSATSASTQYPFASPTSHADAKSAVLAQASALSHDSAYQPSTSQPQGKTHRPFPVVALLVLIAVTLKSRMQSNQRR